jgi:hypothetical protein
VRVWGERRTRSAPFSGAPLLLPTACRPSPPPPPLLVLPPDPPLAPEPAELAAIKGLYFAVARRVPASPQPAAAVGGDDEPSLATPPMSADHVVKVRLLQLQLCTHCRPGCTALNCPGFTALAALVALDSLPWFHTSVAKPAHGLVAARRGPAHRRSPRSAQQAPALCRRPACPCRPNPWAPPPPPPPQPNPPQPQPQPHPPTHRPTTTPSAHTRQPSTRFPTHQGPALCPAPAPLPPPAAHLPGLRPLVCPRCRLPRPAQLRPGEPPPLRRPLPPLLRLLVRGSAGRMPAARARAPAPATSARPPAPPPFFPLLFPPAGLPRAAGWTGAGPHAGQVGGGGEAGAAPTPARPPAALLLLACVGG